MKKFKRICLIMMLIALSFSAYGCTKAGSSEDNITRDKDVDDNEEGTLNGKKDTEVNTEENQVSKPVDFKFNVEFDDEKAMSKGVLTAFDEAGEVIWTYDTDMAYVTELETVQEIGMSRNGYLLLSNGVISCIDVSGSEPSVLWENNEFEGASACWDFDENYNLYIAGYYGPDLMVIDADGKTVNRFDIEDEGDAYWPYSLSYMDGKVFIDFENSKLTYCVDPETGSFETQYMNGTVVSNVEEFVTAISGGTEIILEPGVYNLTDWIMADKEENLPRADMPLWNFDGDNSPGVYIDGVFDGYQLIINGINDIFITSRDPENPAEFVVEPRYAMVLDIRNCDNCEISNVILGHTPDQGSCQGDVLALSNVESVFIGSCDIYGCGAYALDINDCDCVELDDCKIHDCSYGCAEIFDSNVSCSFTEFINCREFTMFEVCGSSVDFYGCTFKNLDGNMIYVDENSQVCFNSCMYDKNALSSIKDNYCYSESEEGQIVIID